MGGKFSCVNVHAEVYLFFDNIQCFQSNRSIKATVAVGEIISYQLEVKLEHLECPEIQ